MLPRYFGKTLCLISHAIGHSWENQLPKIIITKTTILMMVTMIIIIIIIMGLVGRKCSQKEGKK